MKLTSVYEKIASVYGIPGKHLFPTNQITVFVNLLHSGQGTVVVEIVVEHGVLSL